MKPETTYEIQLAEEKHVPLITDLYIRSWRRAYKGLLNQAYLDGLSYEEIAAVVGITVKNVSVRLYRIKEELKQMSNN